MSSRIVRTQDELNKAVAEKVDWIEVRSEAGVWIEITAYDSSTVRACDSSTVTAYDSSTVKACGSSTVRAYDSSTVTAYDSSTVRVYGSSIVRACDSSTVTAYDSSTVRAYDSSIVTACDSSTVTAYDSSTVTAYDSSTVTAYDSSTVKACGSSTVRAYDSSTVTACETVAVHLHDVTVHLSGGTVIDHTKVASFNAAEWCAFHGVKVENGIATLFKAVNDRWTTSRGVDYSPGSIPACDDFRDTNECGGGLHFGPTPVHSLSYFPEATKFVAVRINVSELRPIYERGATAKAKAPRVVRACVQVNIDGKEIVA